MDKAPYTLTLQRGEPLKRRWTFEESEGNAYTPLDLTGYHALLQVRSSADETSGLLLEASDADGTIIMGGDEGWIEFDVPASDILQISAGTYAHDFVLVEPGGDPRYVLSGPVRVEKRIAVIAVEAS